MMGGNSVMIVWVVSIFLSSNPLHSNAGVLLLVMTQRVTASVMKVDNESLGTPEVLQSRHRWVRAGSVVARPKSLAGPMLDRTEGLAWLRNLKDRGWPRVTTDQGPKVFSLRTSYGPPKNATAADVEAAFGVSYPSLRGRILGLGGSVYLKVEPASAQAVEHRRVQQILPVLDHEARLNERMVIQALRSLALHDGLLDGPLQLMYFVPQNGQQDAITLAVEGGRARVVSVNNLGSTRQWQFEQICLALAPLGLRSHKGTALTPIFTDADGHGYVVNASKSESGQVVIQALDIPMRGLTVAPQPNGLQGTYQMSYQHPELITFVQAYEKYLASQVISTVLQRRFVRQIRALEQSLQESPSLERVD
jgi:hypothetical protein